MQNRFLLAMIAAALVVSGAAGLAAAKDDDEKRNGTEREDARDRDGRGPGDRHGRPAFAERGDKWIFHNDHIAVWFHAGKDKAKPDLRVVFNGTEDEKAGYRVKILRLCEVPENETQCTGRLPRINLAKSDDWNVVTEERNGTLTITMVRAEAQGIVTLVWRLDSTHATVKYDVRVDNWRWANESHRLALDMLVVGKNLKNATGANVTVEDSGYITWETTAQATYADGAVGNLTVDAFRKGSKDDKDEDGDSGSHLVLVFDGPGGYRSLDYDPSFGVLASATTTVATPGLAPVAVVAAVAAVALLGARRRT